MSLDQLRFCLSDIARVALKTVDEDGEVDLLHPGKLTTGWYVREVGWVSLRVVSEVITVLRGGRGVCLTEYSDKCSIAMKGEEDDEIDRRVKTTMTKPKH